MKKQLPKQIFIAGIGTGVGKTIASAVLCETLQADYWKPIQCGNLENADTQIVQSLISNSVSKFHPEAYHFKTASSPHYAAKIEGQEIILTHCSLPIDNCPLIIEAAGGLMVPLNGNDLMIDLIKHLNVSVILVVRNYLGSINHTLMSVEILKQSKIELSSIVFSGENFNDNEEIIQHFSGVPVIGRIAESKTIDKKFILEQSVHLKQSLAKHFTL